MQTGPFFRQTIFDEFFAPYYRELVEHAHARGMHFWLHACGNIEPFIPKLIDLGLDVLHPIQKYTMDEREIARRYGGRICIWSGFDVQQIIPFGTPEEVRARCGSSWTRSTAPRAACCSRPATASTATARSRASRRSTTRRTATAPRWCGSAPGTERAARCASDFRETEGGEYRSAERHCAKAAAE